MNEEQARRTAWKILGEVEETMSGQGVGILVWGERDDGCQRAFFRDREYAQLENAIVQILKDAAAQARTPPAGSRPQG
jgi:hypothetical protein